MDIEDLDIKKQFFDTLNERQKRQYAALEAKFLGHGGQLAVSQAFGIEADTIRRGWRELASGEHLPDNRIRRPGGGRKKN
jgi:hypothetical protein